MLLLAYTNVIFTKTPKRRYKSQHSDVAEKERGITKITAFYKLSPRNIMNQLHN
jgi:hypothetical protein